MLHQLGYIALLAVVMFGCLQGLFRVDIIIHVCINVNDDSNAGVWHWQFQSTLVTVCSLIYECLWTGTNSASFSHGSFSLSDWPCCHFFCFLHHVCQLWSAIKKRSMQIGPKIDPRLSNFKVGFNRVCPHSLINLLLHLVLIEETVTDIEIKPQKMLTNDKRLLLCKFLFKLLAWPI